MPSHTQHSLRAMRLVLLVLVGLVFPAFSVDVALAARGSAITGTISGAKDPVIIFLDGLRTVSSATHKHQIAQKNTQFSIKLLVIGTGDSVAFPNNDHVSHNVFSLSRTKKFDFGIYPPGSDRTVQFQEPGLVDVFCNIHQEMHATIAVVPSDYYAASDKQGAFRIADVPAGKYTAVVWRKGKEVRRQAVVVVAGTDAKLELELK